MNRFQKNWLSQALGIVVTVLFAVGLAIGQVTTGSLQGVVRDPNGAVVPGVTVKVTNADTGQSRETTTNDDGYYRVTNLQPGDNYTVEISGKGFAAASATKVFVHLATENSADVAFTQVAGATGSVTVTGSGELIQSTQSQLSTSYSTQQLTQLPINGGLIDNLALLTPGVASVGDADFTNGVGISANGNRGRSNNFQIDGQDNNDNSVAGPSLFLTNTDAIGEYQVITNNYSAEFGRNAGAQVNVITKPGTNEFHGTLFEFLQNSRLNTLNNDEKKAAATFRFLGANGFPFFTGYANDRKGRSPFTYNRFGGSIGGPLKSNKAFFFVTYQHDIQRGETDTNGFNTDSLVLTPASVAAVIASGQFPIGASILGNAGVGGYPTSVKGQGSFLVLPPMLDQDGNGIPDSFLYAPGNPFGNPPQANLLAPVAYIRIPSPAGTLTPLYGGEAIRFYRTDYSEDQLITREDFNVTDRDLVSARYIYDNTKFPLATGRALAGALFDVPSKNNNLGVTYTHTFSPRFVNEGRFNFSRLDVRFGDPAGTKPGPGIGSSGSPRTIFFDFLLTFGTQNNLPQSRVVDVYQEQDTLTATMGNHAIKFGGDIRQQKVKNFFLPNFLGTYTFGGGSTGGIVPANTFYDDTGATRAGAAATSIENILLGRPRQIAFALGNPAINTNQNDYFFFMQDDWRIRPNLTLNLGLRYEVSSQPLNPIIDKVNAREANAATAIFPTSFPLSTRTATRVPLDKNNFAPRVGFAWSPNFKFLGDHFSNGKTVIRGGFGVAYDPSFFNIVLNTVTAAPFAATGIVTQIPGDPGSVSFPFLPSTPAQLIGTPGTNGGDPRLFSQTRVDPNFHNPYTLQYNFGIQQELWKNTVLEVRWVGSRIVGQFQTVTGNPDLHFLARAGQFMFADPTRFTNGIAVTSCFGADPTCPAIIIGSGSTSFNSRGFDTLPPGNVNRITGNGRLNPFQGPTRARINGASGTYNGMQVRFDTRLSNALVLNVNYTWSRTMDNSSEIFSTGGGGQGVADPQRFFDATKGERGRSAFDQRHNLTANFIYDLPWFKEQHGAIGHLLGGYQIASTARIGSGRAYTPLEAFGTYDPSFENGFFGVGALRPFNGNPGLPNGTIAFGYGAACLVLYGGPYCDYAGGTLSPGGFVIFNTLKPGSTGTVVTAAQAQQQARLIYNDFGLNNQFGVGFGSLEAFNLFKTPFGDVGRNTFTGLPYVGVNLAIYKQTKITERVKLEIRGEVTNLLNHRNFGVPDAFTEDAATSFTVSSFQNPGFNTGQRRELRFGMKVIF